MRRDRLTDMKRGWFVGCFEPTLLKTDDVEVAVKRYNAGENEAAHFHKIATEITVIVAGEVEFNGERYLADDIITFEPGETADFRAVTDAITVVVKRPGAIEDKYLI